MSWLPAAGMMTVPLLFAVIGFYLTLIAKFYRQKFMKGPPHRWMQASLAVLVLGLVLRSAAGAWLPAALPPLLICTGGLAFSGLSYRLYRTMMSKS